MVNSLMSRVGDDDEDGPGRSFPQSMGSCWVVSGTCDCTHCEYILESIDFLFFSMLSVCWDYKNGLSTQSAPGHRALPVWSSFNKLSLLASNTDTHRCCLIFVLRLTLRHPTVTETLTLLQQKNNNK